MAYQHNSNGPRNYTKKKSQNDRPRNACMTFTILATGVNKNGFEYNVDEVFDNLADLQKNNVFDIINIPVQIARELIDNEPGKRGQSTVAHVLSYDVESNEMTIMVYGNFVDRIDNITDLVIEPRLMVRDGHVTSILSLDIVKNAFTQEDVDTDDDAEDSAE